MKKVRLSAKKYFGFIRILFVFGIILSLFFTVIALTLYEKDEHYFRLYSVTPKVFAVLMLLLAVLSFAVAFLAPKNKFSENALLSSKQNKLSDLTSIACGVFVFITVAARFPDFFRSFAKSELPAENTSGKLALLRTLFIVFGLVAAAFFFSVCFRAKREVRAFLGFGVIVYFIIYLLTVYFDTEIPINSPMRILDQLTTIGMLIWFMLEERFIIETPKPFLYISVGIIAAPLCFALGLSTVLCTLTGRMTENAFAAVGAFEALAFGVWICVRVYSFVCTLVADGADNNEKLKN